MILHYLGLDHIGHISGPKSPLIREKLKEMDRVIEKVYHQFQATDTAIIVCGDHGIIRNFQCSMQLSLEFGLYLANH